MRINIMIDDDLMKNALIASGLKTQKDVIEAGLRLLVKCSCQVKIRKYRGKLKWSGKLDEMRAD